MDQNVLIIMCVYLTQADHMMEYDTGSQVVREMLYHWSRLYSSRRAMQEELQVVYQALSDE